MNDFYIRHYWRKKYEKCHCPKESHRNDHYHWIKKRECIQNDNTSLLVEEKRRNEDLKQLNEKTNNKNKINSQIDELNYNKKLEEEKKKNLHEKRDMEVKIIIYHIL